jgi:propanol-preferring alcohol dehydrogenase
MRALVLHRPGTKPDLRVEEIELPAPAEGELLLGVRACAVCRTDLHVVDGELAGPKLPLVLGHQIVGVVEALGAGASRFRVGDRVGVPWLGRACGECDACLRHQENLCDRPLFTGFTRDGGFAEACVADERFVFPIPPPLGDLDAAPLLCGGLIGWRALRLAGLPEATRRVGFYGFGSSAHLLAQLAVAQGREIHAFTRPGDTAAQQLARSLGAAWAGGSDEPPPAPLDAALVFAPVGALVPKALAAVRQGGTVVCAGIHMSAIPSFPYELLWGERTLRSVANLTRADGEELLPLAARLGVRPRVERFPLERAVEALDALRAGRVVGSAVVVP